MRLFTSFAFVLLFVLTLESTLAQSRSGRGQGSGGRGPGPSHRPAPSRPSPAPHYSPSPRRSQDTPSRRYQPSPAPSQSPRYGQRPAPRPTTRPAPRPAPRPGTYTRPSAPPRPTPTPRYDHHRPSRNDYGTPSYHRPYGHRPVTYQRTQHVPYRVTHRHTNRFYRSYEWYNYVHRSFPQYIYVNWIFYPAIDYTNGYWEIDHYPYYVFNGHRYRYSHLDYCNYQLVDQYTHEVLETYWNQFCQIGYDQCSFERDRLNEMNNEFRYFCSETFQDYGYGNSRQPFDDLYY